MARCERKATARGAVRVVVRCTGRKFGCCGARVEFSRKRCVDTTAWSEKIVPQFGHEPDAK